MGKTATMTAAEFFPWLQEQEDDYELLNGAPVMSPSPAFRHQEAVSRLMGALIAHVDKNDVGLVMTEIDWWLAPDWYLRPDITYCHYETLRRLLAHGDQRHLKGGAPELCVEVTSPGQSGRDLIEKREAYEQAGLGEYWVVDTQRRSFHFFRRPAEGAPFEEEQMATGTYGDCAPLPGLALDIDAFWGRLLSEEG